MKHLLFILLLYCCHVHGQVKKDYQVAQQALSHLHEYKEFRLLSIPNNDYIEECLNGFYSGEVYGKGTLDFRNIKFSYADDRVKEWGFKTKLWGTVGEKIEIVKDFEKIPKVSLTEANKAQTYVRLSNPAFSKDGNYAIIFFEHFTNMNGTDAVGFVLIFKKEKGGWIYFSQFTAYLT